LDGRGYYELALIAQAEGNMPQAEILMQQAVRRSPRDLGIRDWLLRDALIEGRTGDALDQIDVMLRVDPEAGKDLYPSVALTVNDPQALSALAQMLAKDPPWRAAFWGQLCASGVSVDSIEALVNQLASSPKPLRDNERTAWLERLIVDHRWSQAFPLWVETLPVERRSQISNIHDGSFELPAQNSGFGWRFGYVAGAKIERIGPPGASYLHIGFGDRRVPFDHVRQLLALSPGAYRMQGRVRSDGLRSERGLQWVVTCAAGAGQRIGESDRFSGLMAWRDFNTDVVVPDSGCGAQWLRLQIAARIPAEQQVDGTIDFTDLRIDRVAERAGIALINLPAQAADKE
jgi:hypothetical protein